MFNHSEECTALLVEPWSSRGFLLISISVSLANVRQDLLFYAC